MSLHTPQESVVILDGELNLLATIVMLDDGTLFLYDGYYNRQKIGPGENLDDVIDDITKDCYSFSILSMPID